jgi:Flp pilus assembly pilin Flp
MRSGSRKFIDGLRGSIRQEGGQDIVEYALLASMIGLGVTAGARSMAQVLLTVLNQITTALSTNIT